MDCKKYKMDQYLKESTDKFVFIYKNNKYNIIVLSISMVILSRVLMYLIYKVGYSFLNKNLNFIRTINTWDSGWYRGIIENGYNLRPVGHASGNAANWAFFPAYPLIIKSIHYIVPIDIYLLGTIVSTIFFIGVLIVGYVYIVETRKNQNQALLFMLIMSFGMYSFYFSILYTESLYLFLLILVLYFLHKEKYILMGIVGALLSATRNLGVMLVFAVLVQYTINYLNKEDKSLKGYFITAFKDSNLILGTCLIPLGMFSYMAYLGKLMGDPMAFTHIQIAWGRVISNPLQQLKIGLLGGIESIYLSMWAIFAFMCVLWFVIEKRWTECIVSIIFIMIPLSTGVTSIPRYVIGAFVYVLSFTDFIAKINKRWLWIGVFIASSIIEIILLFKWFQQAPFLT